MMDCLAWLAVSKQHAAETSSKKRYDVQHMLARHVASFD